MATAMSASKGQACPTASTAANAAFAITSMSITTETSYKSTSMVPVMETVAPTVRSTRTAVATTADIDTVVPTTVAGSPTTADIDTGKRLSSARALSLCPNWGNRTFLRSSGQLDRQQQACAARRAI